MSPWSITVLPEATWNNKQNTPIYSFAEQLWKTLVQWKMNEWLNERQTALIWSSSVIGRKLVAILFVYNKEGGSY